MNQSRRLEFAKYLEQQMKEIDALEDEDSLFSVAPAAATTKKNKPSSNQSALTGSAIKKEKGSVQWSAPPTNNKEEEEETDVGGQQRFPRDRVRVGKQQFRIHQLNDKIADKFPEAPLLPVAMGAEISVSTAMSLALCIDYLLATMDDRANVDSLTRTLSLLKTENQRAKDRERETAEELAKLKSQLAIAERERNQFKGQIDQAEKRADSFQTEAHTNALAMSRRVAHAIGQKEKAEKELERLKDKLKEALLYRRTQRAPANSVVYGPCLNSDQNMNQQSSTAAATSISTTTNAKNSMGDARLKQLEQEKAMLQKELLHANNELLNKSQQQQQQQLQQYDDNDDICSPINVGKPESSFAAPDTTTDIPSFPIDTASLNMFINDTAVDGGPTTDMDSQQHVRQQSTAAAAVAAAAGSQPDYKRFSILVDDEFNTSTFQRDTTDFSLSSRQSLSGLIAKTPLPAGGTQDDARARQARERLLKFMQKQELNQQHMDQRQQQQEEQERRRQKKRNDEDSFLWEQHKLKSPFLALSPKKASLRSPTIKAPSPVIADDHDVSSSDDDEIQINVGRR